MRRTPFEFTVFKGSTCSNTPPTPERHSILGAFAYSLHLGEQGRHILTGTPNTQLYENWFTKAEIQVLILTKVSRRKFIVKSWMLLKKRMQMSGRLCLLDRREMSDFRKRSENMLQPVQKLLREQKSRDYFPVKMGTWQCRKLQI